MYVEKIKVKMLHVKRKKIIYKKIEFVLQH